MLNEKEDGNVAVFFALRVTAGYSVFAETATLAKDSAV